MKQIFFSLILLEILFLRIETIQAQSLPWFKTFGSNSSDQGVDVISDSSGSAYVTGYFSDSLIVGITKLYSKGNEDGFLVKYDSAGKVIWATSFGGIYTDGPKEINFSMDGNILMTGYFSDTCYFGNEKIISFGYYDMFVYKIDASTGAPLWINSAGSWNNYEQGNSVVDDGKGNVLAGGNFYNKCFFGSTDSLTGNGLLDFFIVKYDEDGNFKWAKNLGGKGIDDINSISSDASHNIYGCGIFQDTMSIENTKLISEGQFDMYWCKLNADGDLIWIKSAGSIGSENALKIIALPEGDFYLGGRIADSVLFEGQWLKDNGNGDIFISRFTQNGNLRWVHSGYSVNAPDYLRDLTVDKFGNAYICGLGNFVIERMEDPNERREEAEQQFSASQCPFGDMVLMKYDTAGNREWTEHTLGNNLNMGMGIAVDNLGNCYATGYFTDSLWFGNTLRIGSGANDVLVLKFKDKTFITRDDKSVVNNFFFPSIHPNPFHDEAFISVQSSHAENVLISVIDLSGRILRKYNPTALNEGTTVLPFYAKLTPGFYFLNIEGEFHSTVLKFIVQ